MPQDVPSLEGQLLADKYRVERLLGEGGMGRVLLAYHTGIGQRVALKLLHSELARRDQTATERFKREAHTSARIRHPHVCRVLDAGTLSDGTPYLAMEYLEGRDLSEELAERGRLPVQEAVALVRQACDGVHEAHRLGIVHRDLKPQNLFVAKADADASGPSLKVLDFGISQVKLEGSAGARLTRTASLVGSPLYMSPEQLHADKDLDARADVWALGCILYELLAGRPPFVAETIPQLVHAVLHTEPPSLASFGISAPGGLPEVIARALHKSREGRYASARELAEALLPYAPMGDTVASGARARTPEPRVPSPSTTGLGPRDATPLVTPSQGLPARRALLWAALGFGGVVMALGAALLSRSGGPSPAELPPQAPSPVASVDAGPPVAAQPGALGGAVGSAAGEPASPADAAATAEAPDAGGAAAVAPSEPGKPAGAAPSAVHASRPVWTPRPKPAASGAEAPSAAPPTAPPASPARDERSDLPSFGGRR